MGAFIKADSHSRSENKRFFFLRLIDRWDFVVDVDEWMPVTPNVVLLTCRLPFVSEALTERKCVVVGRMCSIGFRSS